MAGFVSAVCLTVPARADRPVDVATRLYRDFAWEVVFAASAEPVFIDQPLAVLERYLTPELAAAVRADRACAARTHEICRLDFDPLWDAQDPAATGLRITQGAVPTRVDVSFDAPGGRHVVVHLRLRRTASGWRIADFIGGDGRGLQSLLRGAPTP